MIVLAQHTPQDISRGYDNYLGTRNPQYAWVLVGALLVILLLILAWQFVRLAKLRRGPRMLFHDLASLHNIPHKMQRRLLHIAKAHKVHDPAWLFVCPDLVKTIESKEVSQAGSSKERERLTAFFSQYKTAAFG